MLQLKYIILGLLFFNKHVKVEENLQHNPTIFLHLMLNT